MVRKSLIQREKKRQALERKYHLICQSLEEKSKVSSLDDKWEIHRKLQSSPRNSAPTRLHRRCSSLEDLEPTIETLDQFCLINNK